MPNFSFNSLAMCSCPQVEFSAAIGRINALGRRGLPTGRDFHSQNRQNPLRCHRISVWGLTTPKALRQSNDRLRRIINQRVIDFGLGYLLGGQELPAEPALFRFTQNKFGTIGALFGCLSEDAALDLERRTTQPRPLERAGEGQF